jgi:hypothetical protein
MDTRAALRNPRINFRHITTVLALFSRLSQVGVPSRILVYLLELVLRGPALRTLYLAPNLQNLTLPWETFSRNYLHYYLPDSAAAAFIRIKPQFHESIIKFARRFWDYAEAEQIHREIWQLPPGSQQQMARHFFKSLPPSIQAIVPYPPTSVWGIIEYLVDYRQSDPPNVFVIFT